MNTPWGKSDSKINIERGVSWVSTPSHGGLAITGLRAVQKLSHNAIVLALRQQYGTEFVNFPKNAYLFFEEDCMYAIAFYEHPEWYQMLEAHTFLDYHANPDSQARDWAAKHLANSKRPHEDIKREMSEVIQRWYPEYFSIKTEVR